MVMRKMLYRVFVFVTLLYSNVTIETERIKGVKNRLWGKSDSDIKAG